MRILMCPPDFYDVMYEINAWMRVERTPDRSLAQRQWEDLYNLLNVRLGVDVDLIAAHAGVPDMVFTANAGLIDGERYVPSRFRHAERQAESPFFERWFSAHGYKSTPIPAYICGTHEGEGDALYWSDKILCGYGHRSDIPAHCAVGSLLGREIVPLGLIDPRWYHLDTCLLPLSADLIGYYPGAFDDEALRLIRRLPAEMIEISENDALAFGANAVVAGKHVVLNSGCDQLEADLESHGFRVHPTPLSEFMKAGGAAKCLSLLLER